MISKLDASTQCVMSLPVAALAVSLNVDVSYFGKKDNVYRISKINDQLCT